MIPIGSLTATLVGNQQNPARVLPEQGGVFFVTRSLNKSGDGFLTSFSGKSGTLQLLVPKQLDPGSGWFLVQKRTGEIEIHGIPPQDRGTIENPFQSLIDSYSQLPGLIKNPEFFTQGLIMVLQELFLSLDPEPVILLYKKYHQIGKKLPADWALSLPVLRFSATLTALSIPFDEHLFDVDELVGFLAQGKRDTGSTSEPSSRSTSENLTALFLLMNTLGKKHSSRRPHWEFYELTHNDRSVGLLQVYYSMNENQAKIIELVLPDKKDSTRIIQWKEPQRENLYVQDSAKLPKYTYSSILLQLKEHGFIDIIDFISRKEMMKSFSSLDHSAILKNLYG